MIYIYTNNKPKDELINLNCLWNNTELYYNINDDKITAKQFYEIWLMHDNNEILIFNETKNKRIDMWVLVEYLYALKQKEKNLI